MITRYLVVCSDSDKEQLVIEKWLKWIRQDFELYLCKSVPDTSDPYVKIETKKLFRTKTAFELKEALPVWLDEFDYICVDKPDSFRTFTGSENIMSLQRFLELMET